MRSSFFKWILCDVIKIFNLARALGTEDSWILLYSSLLLFFLCYCCYDKWINFVVIHQIAFCWLQAEHKNKNSFLFFLIFIPQFFNFWKSRRVLLRSQCSHRSSSLRWSGVVCDMMWCVLCGVVWCGSWVQWVKKIRSDYRLMPYLSYSLYIDLRVKEASSLNRALDGSRCDFF